MSCGFYPAAGRHRSSNDTPTLADQVLDLQRQLEEAKSFASSAQDSYIRREDRYREQISQMQKELDQQERMKEASEGIELSSLRRLHKQVLEAVDTASQLRAQNMEEKTRAVALAFRAQLQDIEDQLEAAQRRIGVGAGEESALWERRIEALQRLSAWLEQECTRLYNVNDQMRLRAEAAETERDSLLDQRQRLLRELVATRWEAESAQSEMAAVNRRLEAALDTIMRLESELQLRKLPQQGSTAVTGFEPTRDYVHARTQVKSLQLQCTHLTQDLAATKQRLSSAQAELDKKNRDQGAMMAMLERAFVEARIGTERKRDEDALLRPQSEDDQSVFALSREQRQRLVQVLLSDAAVGDLFQRLTESRPLDVPPSVMAQYPGNSAEEVAAAEMDAELQRVTHV